MLISTATLRTGLERAYHLTYPETFTITDIPDNIEKLTLESREYGAIHQIDIKTDPDRQDRTRKRYAEIDFDAPGLYRISLESESGERFASHRCYVVVDPAKTGSFRMYTLIPSVSGPISGWTRLLDDIEELGFDMIQLLPLTEMGRSLSPYSISDHFVIDPAYGDPSTEPSDNNTPASREHDFEKFAEECASRGIGLCIDLVLNHVAPDGRVANEHPEWIAEDVEEADGMRRAGWSDSTTWHKWLDLVRLDYAGFSTRERNALWRHMNRYALYWSEYAAKTGGIVRFDNLHSTDPAFARFVVGSIRRRYPEILMLGELFGTERNILRTANSLGINLLLGTPWEHKFVPELRRYLSYVHRMHNRLRYHFPITSHDSGSPAEEFGSVASIPPRLVTSMLLAPGATGIVEGVELGVEKRLHFIGKPAKIELEGTIDYRSLVSRLAKLHRDDALFQRGGNLLFVDSFHEAIIAALRLDPETGAPGYLVCANFDTQQEQKIDLHLEPFAGSTLTGLLDEKNLRLDDSIFSIVMKPGGIRVYQIES